MKIINKGFWEKLFVLLSAFILCTIPLQIKAEDCNKLVRSFVFDDWTDEKAAGYVYWPGAATAELADVTSDEAEDVAEDKKALKITPLQSFTGGSWYLGSEGAISAGKTYLIDFYGKIDNSNTIDSQDFVCDGGQERDYTWFKMSKEYERYSLIFNPTTDCDSITLRCSNPGVVFYIFDLNIYELAELKLVSSYPAHGSTVMPADCMSITFNNEMDEAAVADINNYIVDGLNIVGIENTGDSKTFIIRFENEMTENTAYSIAISNLKDSLQQELETQIISFQTTEYGKPSIDSVSPADGSVDIGLSDKMTVKFDTDMDISTFITDNIKVNGSDENIEAVLVDEANPREFIISFKNLEYMTLYTIELSGIKSLREKTIDNTKISFVTKAEEEITFENNISSSTDVGYPNISYDGANITLTYDETEYASAPAALKVYATGELNQDIYLAGGTDGKRLTVGEYYEISFAVKSGENNAGKLYVVNGDNASFLTSIGAVPDEWTKYSKIFCANTETMPWFRVGGEPCNLYIDDIKLVKITPTGLMPTSVFPQMCQTDADVDGEYTLIFNNDIKPELITAESIKINDKAVNVISAESKKIVFKAQTELEYDTVYKISVKLTDCYDREFGINREFRTKSVFETNGVKFYAGDINITNSSLTGGEIKAVIDRLDNNTEAAAVACVILALYKDTKMISTSAKEIPIAAGEGLNKPAEAVITLPDALTDGEYVLKAFLWKNFNDIIPLAIKTEVAE